MPSLQLQQHQEACCWRWEPDALKHWTKRVTAAALHGAGERHLACELEILGHFKDTNQAYTVPGRTSQAGCLVSPGALL